jgi:hypothetical protein
MHETTVELLDRLSCNTALKNFTKRCDAISVLFILDSFNGHNICRPICVSVCILSITNEMFITEKKVVDKMKHFMFNTFLKSCSFRYKSDAFHTLQIPIRCL